MCIDAHLFGNGHMDGPIVEIQTVLRFFLGNAQGQFKDGRVWLRKTDFTGRNEGIETLVQPKSLDAIIVKLLALVVDREDLDALLLFPFDQPR